MADFTLTPDFVFPKRTNYATLISEFENGVEQRRSRRSVALREWTLQFKNRTAANVATVQAIFDSSKGSYASFTWTNPLDAQDYTVRFKEDVFEAILKTAGLYDFQFDLVQVI